MPKILLCLLLMAMVQVSQAQTCFSFQRQNWIVLPSDASNLSVVDGRPYLYSDGLLYAVQISANAAVGLIGDTACFPLDEQMDYVTRHPLSHHLFYTRRDSKGRHKLYEVIPREGKKPKVSRVKLKGMSTIDHPTFSPDGNVMVFSSTGGSYGGRDLYYTRLDRKGKWTEPRCLEHGVNTQGDEIAPVVMGEYLFYATRDTGSQSAWNLASTVLYSDTVGMASMYPRVGQNKSYRLPAPYNTEADDLEIAFDTLKRRVYLLSRRDGSTALYMYYGSMPLAVVAGRVSDANGESLADVDISLFESDRQIFRTTSAADGSYRLLLPRNGSYSLWLSKPGYFGNSVEVDTRQTDPLCAVSEQLFDVALDNLALGSKSYLFDLFGHSASVELSSHGKRQLQRLVRFLYENPQISLHAELCSIVAPDDELNGFVTARRIENLRNYLHSVLPRTSCTITAGAATPGTYNSRLTVQLQ